MKLNQYMTQREEFLLKGFALPEFDRNTVYAKTKEMPTWLHFGAGNIFRAFPAHLQQKLLNEGLAETGIIVAEGFDDEIIGKAYRPYDNISLLSVLKADGTVDHIVIGSVTESLIVSNEKDHGRLKEIFAAPSLQMVSFTITEKGYASTQAGSMMAVLTDLLYHRYQNGAYPLALVSMDNCSHNGEKVEQAVRKAAEDGVTSGRYEESFLYYISDRKKVAFPWSMIDKITPRPDEAVRTLLEEAGFEDTEIIVTEKHSYTAAFVNAEQAEYLVVEDDFPNGRPALDKAGVLFTDREHVNMVERMKVCTCLNPLHTALAIFGSLLGKKTICEEMQDEDLVRLVDRLGYTEGMPVVTDPSIMDPKAFIRDVLTLRLPNPFMPDTPQRIATDTSQKLSIRFGETIKAYMTDVSLRTDSLTVIPLVLAGWFRYLTGVDDAGNAFEVSPDPMLEDLNVNTDNVEDRARVLLHDASIFGVDLAEAGLADKLLTSLHNMLQGNGAVRAEIERILS